MNKTFRRERELNRSQIWQLHLPIARKLAVIAVFLMGILASGSSLVRLAWMVYNVKVGFGDSTDEERKYSTTISPQ